MSASRVKLQLIAFLLLSAGVAANVFVLQPNGGSRIAARSVPPLLERTLAQAQGTFTGNTGSIGRKQGVERTDLPLIPVAAGASASEVTRAVQRELQARGYETGAADGVAGLVTRAAIMGFEHDHGLPLTGTPSQTLLKAIVLGAQGVPAQAAGSAPLPSAAAQGVIKSVQAALTRLAYKPGPAEGRMTPATVRAIREFEVDQAMPESGRVSGPLAARLARLAGRGRVASGP